MVSVGDGFFLVELIWLRSWDFSFEVSSWYGTAVDESQIERFQGDVAVESEIEENPKVRRMRSAGVQGHFKSRL